MMRNRTLAARAFPLLALLLASIAGCKNRSKRPDDPAIALKNSGIAHMHRGDYDQAIQDLTQAIARKPQFASAYNTRGLAYGMLGQYDRALADFDRAIALIPNYALAIKNRGRTHFYLGQFAQAAADLDRGSQLDSTNAYVAIWRHMSQQRLGQDDAQHFTAQWSRMDSTTWPAPVAQFYLGKITRDQLMRVAATSNSSVQRDQRCAAAFYIGEYQLWHHDTVGAAKNFQTTRTTCPADWTEYQAAVAELARLAGSPQ